jgi:hypothetical protein
LDLIVIATLCWISVLSAFGAAGYSVLNLALIVTGTSVPLEAVRWTRIALVVTGVTALIIAVNATGPHWRRLLRMLSVL